MAAKSKKAKKLRTADEFSPGALTRAVKAPKVSSAAYAWSLDMIRGARDAQMRGDFRQAARLAEMLNTDPALFTARLNRLAPLRGLPVQLVAPNKSSRAAKVRDEAEALYGPKGVGIRPDTVVTLNQHLADHGLAISQNIARVHDDGSRVDILVEAWPIEHVRWDPMEQVLKTRVEDSFDEVTIVHGDGRWTVYQNHQIEPWKHGAVLPAALVWPSSAYGRRDWNKSSTSIGNAKVVGTMPDGVPIDSAEGAAFLQLLADVASVETPVGIKPFGSTLDYITNNSQAWQIFKEQIGLANSDAAKIYLGQDGTVNNSGGNYIKSDVLFGVRNDVVEGDLSALARGFLTGVIEIWAAINFGDSALAPSREWLMPDADEDARRESLAKQVDAFNKAVTELRANGFVVDQALVEELAETYGVTAPKLADSTPVGGDFADYELEGGIVTIDEVRARKGLPPLPDGMGARTVPQARAAAEAAASAPPGPALRAVPRG